MSHLRTLAALAATSVLLSGCAAAGVVTATQRLAGPEFDPTCGGGTVAYEDDCLPPKDDPSEAPSQPTSLLPGNDTTPDAPASLPAAITTTDFTVAVDGPGSFTLPLPTGPYGLWTADHTDGGAYLMDVSTAWDPSWPDLGFQGLLTQDDSGGPVRAIITTPYEDMVATFTVEADPLPDGMTIDEWYRDVAPRRTLPPADTIVGVSDFDALDDDTGIALYDFSDRTVLVVVMADRGHGLAWRASMTLPIIAPTDQQADELIHPLFAATISKFVPYADASFAG